MIAMAIMMRGEFCAQSGGWKGGEIGVTAVTAARALEAAPLVYFLLEFDDKKLGLER